jgi:hypothetical protein
LNYICGDKSDNLLYKLKVECSIYVRFSDVYFQSVDLAKLKGDNLQLQADIQLMTREVDLMNNGQSKFLIKS